MKVITKSNGWNDWEYKDIFLEEKNNVLIMTFGGNGDLYWVIREKKPKERELKHGTFIITKENYRIYSAFESLYNNIKEINFFDPYDIPPFMYSYEENLEYINERKERCRKYNDSNYNELFNPKTNTITWYSDETHHDVANYVTVKRNEDNYKIDFNTQPRKKDYDNEYNGFGISIRFRNSGSSYDPFNAFFMQMYNSIQDVDDVNDINHQMHIEEYLYNKKLTLNKNK